MELFGYPVSPFVRHVLIALDQTGLTHTFNLIDTKQAASLSPTKKVPLLKDGDLTLSDSTTIVRYIREKANQPFLADIQQQDIFCLTNTLMDSTINVFLYERYGLDTSNSGYFDRQRARVEDGLDYLEKLHLTYETMDIDAFLRLACYLSWGLFRERIALNARPTLATLLAQAVLIPEFQKTLPSSY